MSGDHRPRNPEKDQDRAADLFDLWTRYGYVMFPQQQSVYRNLSRCIAWNSVLEAGCGDGVGSAILAQKASTFIGTDKLARNVAFAKALYSWLDFEVWDVQTPWRGQQVKSVVCVEALEHVANPEKALANLIAAATQEVWISTPNGRVKGEHPPSNPYHVQEFTPRELLALLPGREVEIFHYETFARLGVETDVNPLVFRVKV